MHLWFNEEDESGFRPSFRVEDILFRGQSEFQSVDVIVTKSFGRMLLIDGLVMVTDLDEFVYHEMIAHVPALLHPCPKNVVVIGGGDGGTVRELLKHPEVEKITLCEIDGLVVETAKKYFPKLASCLDDPRVEVRIGDGVGYMKEHPASALDLVIVDSTDPIGPGEGLFSREFYRSVSASLKEGGLMACQSESPWFEKSLLQRISRNVSGGFEFRYPYIGAVPTYPRGFWSWTLASNQPVRSVPQKAA